jgi:hypothetical protein
MAYATRHLGGLSDDVAFELATGLVVDVVVEADKR